MISSDSPNLSKHRLECRKSPVILAIRSDHNLWKAGGYKQTKDAQNWSLTFGETRRLITR
jgi:hypothetical protein